MNKQFAKIAAGATLLAGAVAAHADTFDTTKITEAGTTVATVGAAVFAVMVGIKVFKWVRRAL